MTVYSDGRVEAMVDLSEASDIYEASIPEGQDESPETIQADIAAIDAAVAARRVCVTD